MALLLSAMALWVLMGLATRRFGRAQTVASLTLAATMTALYLFVPGLY